MISLSPPITERKMTATRRNKSQISTKEKKTVHAPVGKKSAATNGKKTAAAAPKGKKSAAALRAKKTTTEAIKPIPVRPAFTAASAGKRTTTSTTTPVRRPASVVGTPGKTATRSNPIPTNMKKKPQKPSPAALREANKDIFKKILADHAVTYRMLHSKG